eukprot:COSAG01_NODE_6166_length_3814_cov_46.365276_4_plen_41_part_00
MTQNTGDGRWAGAVRAPGMFVLVRPCVRAANPRHYHQRLI